MSKRPPQPVVVLIDDDAPLRSALTFALEAQGYAVIAYERAGLVKGGDIGAASCIVIDQALPDGLGLDLLQRLRGEGLAAPAVLITTSPSTMTIRDAKAAGAPIVEKPLLGDELFALIRRNVASGRPNL